jgi:NitT/TauT family transport system substrate-binding protein
VRPDAGDKWRRDLRAGRRYNQGICLISTERETMGGMDRTWSAFLLACFLLAAAGASADEKVSVAVGNRGVGETELPEFGVNTGIFKKHGLDVDIRFGQSSVDALTAVVSGSCDIGIGVGILGTFSAYAKGGPVRIIGAAFTGDTNMFLYVPAASPIKTMKDTAGKSIGFSNPGSSSQIMVLEAAKYFDLKYRPIATGGGPATLTQVMSGQIDVGWSGAPFAVDGLDSGKIRLLLRASELPAMAGQTSRVLLANADDFKRRPDVSR